MSYDEIRRTNLEFLAVLWHLRETESTKDTRLFLTEMLMYEYDSLPSASELDFYFTFFCEEVTSLMDLNSFITNLMNYTPQCLEEFIRFSGEDISPGDLPGLIVANPTKWVRIYGDFTNIVRLDELALIPDVYEFVPGEDIPDELRVRIWLNVVGSMAFMDPPVPLIDYILEMDPPDYFLETEWSEEEKGNDHYRLRRMIYLFHEHWKKIKKLPLRVVDIPPSEVIITNYAIGPKIVPKKVEVVSSYLVCVASLEYGCDCNILEWIVSGYF